MKRILLVAASALSGSPVLAQTAPYVEPGLSSGGSLLQVFIGLVAVLLLIVATGWITRRLGIAGGGAGGLLQVVSSTAVGTRERIVIVEVGETWLVVGVAPGSVNTLMTLPKGEAGTMAASARNTALSGWTPFRERLQQMIDKRRDQ